VGRREVRATSDGSTIHVRFPDGTSVEVPRGTPLRDLLAPRVAPQGGRPLAGLVDGVPVDLAFRLERDVAVAPLTFEDRQGREILQHSAAHLVAKGVLEVEGAALPTVGPPTDEGFYYDFDMRPLSPDDIPKIVASMDRAVTDRSPFERVEVDRAEAERLVAGNRHKLDYVQQVPAGETISFYRTGTFVDLCRGPHVPDTGWLAGVEILGFSGVTSGPEGGEITYQRIRGVGFPTDAERVAYRKLRKEAEARDHRIVGPRQGLFTFFEEAPGFPVWLPKGMIVVRELERFVQEHLARSGYSEIRTPLLFAQSVFERSGHWEHYRENMFLTAIDQRPFALKPMNCPGTMMIFGSTDRSYRELPMRLAEFAPLHRLEASGTIHGLTRVREFVQDDAHLFVTEEQIPGELRSLIDWIREAFTVFHLEWSYELSTRPDHFLGSTEEWDKAQAFLLDALKECGVAYRISPGEGAFYGPKIDIHVRDSLGRPWQTGTIQVDYQQPQRFALKYQGADGALHTPVVIHRTILGTWERFFGVFLEHCNGRLPPWMAPEQVRVLPVGERHAAHAESVAGEYRAAGLRAQASDSQDTLGKRIRAAELARIPYVLVVGDQEAADGTVTVRRRGVKENQTLPSAEFLATTRQRIAAREYDP
jgi:threonyl-tRNA synthetase